MPDRNISEARRLLEQLLQVFSDSDVIDEQVAIQYQSFKSSLSRTVSLSLVGRLREPDLTLGDIKRSILTLMRSHFAGSVDDSLLHLSGYSSPHPDLYAQLVTSGSVSSPGWLFRLLTAEAVHTERRLRELRDLGLKLEITQLDGDSLYRLVDEIPDLRYGAAFQLRRNASTSKRVSLAEKRRAINIAEDFADLPILKTRGFSLDD